MNIYYLISLNLAEYAINAKKDNILDAPSNYILETNERFEQICELETNSRIEKILIEIDPRNKELHLAKLINWESIPQITSRISLE